MEFDKFDGEALEKVREKHGEKIGENAELVLDTALACSIEQLKYTKNRLEEIVEELEDEIDAMEEEEDFL